MEASKHKIKKEGQVLHQKRSIRTGRKGKEKISQDDVQENDKIHDCKDHCGENGRVIECPVCGSTLLKHHVEVVSLSPPRPKEPWRKILYIRQDYPDNYVEPSIFLTGLITNANKREYDTWTLMCDVITVGQQLNSVSIFVLFFIELYSDEEQWGVPFLLTSLLLLTLAGLLLRLYADVHFSVKLFFRSVKNLSILVGILFGLSPVVKTLVASFSSDTIWALTIGAFVIHLFWHDYSYTNGSNKTMDAPLSFNAAVFATVLLASRLQGTLLVFALLCFSVDVFALFPVARHHIKKNSLRWHLGSSLFMFLLSAVLLYRQSRAASVAFISATLFITLVCPVWLKWMQRFKFEINGPWDEAIPLKQ